MIDIKIITHLEIDGSIDVLVNQDGITKPIDSIGTGVLQSIQVAAYTFYFQPRLLLLDEPDSHLHPNNQKVLAGLIQLLTNSSGNQIVLATHSRQLLSSLRKCSSTTLMKNGRSEEYRDEYDILLEIGALDNFDLIKNPNVNYLILTEDSAPESIDMLKIILLSSGYDINEFMIVSYAGVSNINFAKLAANCIQLLRESLTVIIHRDRDSLYDDEVENLVGEIEKNPSTYCFVTKYSDLEMYFCKPQHISEHLLQLNLSELVAPNEVADIVADAINQVSELSSEKFMNRRIDGSNQNRAREARKATDYFTSNKIRCSYGKGVIGRIRNALQDRLARNISLVSVSMFLEDQYLVKIKEER